jgi:hypothetical protein
MKKSCVGLKVGMLFLIICICSPLLLESVCASTPELSDGVAVNSNEMYAVNEETSIDYLGEPEPNDESYATTETFVFVPLLIAIVIIAVIAVVAVVIVVVVIFMKDREPEIEAQSRICLKCGSHIDKDSKFCPQCGEPVKRQ